MEQYQAPLYRESIWKQSSYPIKEYYQNSPGVSLLEERIEVVVQHSTFSTRFIMFSLCSGPDSWPILG